MKLIFQCTLGLTLLFMVAGFAQYGQSPQKPSSSFSPPPKSNSFGGGGYEQDIPQPYKFSYDVNDAYSGSNYNQQEQSDGNVVSGSYVVNLPDGRVQTVRYRSDHDTGFVADVTYDGQARYPDKKMGGYPPAPKQSQSGGYQQQQQQNTRSYGSFQ